MIMDTLKTSYVQKFLHSFQCIDVKEEGEKNNLVFHFHRPPLLDNSYKSIVDRVKQNFRLKDLQNIMDAIILCVKKALSDAAMRRKKIEDAMKLLIKSYLQKKKKTKTKLKKNAPQNILTLPRRHSEPSFVPHRAPPLASGHIYGRLDVPDIEVNLEEVFQNIFTMFTMSVENAQNYMEKTVLRNAKTASAWIAYVCSHYDHRQGDFIYDEIISHMILSALCRYGLRGNILKKIGQKGIHLLHSLYDQNGSPKGIIYVDFLPTTGYTDKDLYHEFSKEHLSMCALFRNNDSETLGKGFLCFIGIEEMIDFIFSSSKKYSKYEFATAFPMPFTSESKYTTFFKEIHFFMQSYRTIFRGRTPDDFKTWTQHRSPWFGRRLNSDPFDPAIVFRNALQIQTIESTQQYIEDTVLISVSDTSAWLDYLFTNYNGQSTELLYHQKFAHIILWTLSFYGMEGAIEASLTTKSLLLVNAIYSIYDTPETPSGVIFVKGLPSNDYTDKDFYREFRQVIRDSLSMCALVRVTEKINIGGFLCFPTMECVVRFLSTYQDHSRFTIMLPGFSSPVYIATFGIVEAYEKRTPERFLQWTQSRSKWFGLVLEHPLDNPSLSVSTYSPLVEIGNRIYFQILDVLKSEFITDLPIPKSIIDRQTLSGMITQMVLEGDWDEEDRYILLSSNILPWDWTVRIIRAAFELLEKHPDLWKQKFQQQQ